MVHQSVQAIYPIFVPNQVLESKALNELSDYFSEQTHLTRQHLIGVGILKGLQVSAFTKVVSSQPPSSADSLTAGAETITAPIVADASAVADATEEGIPPVEVQTRNIVATIQLSAGNCLTPNGYYLSLSDIVFTHYSKSGDLFTLNNLAAAKSGSVIEIFDTAPNDGFLLSQLLTQVPPADTGFSNFFSDKALVMVADLQERPRQGLIHYEVQYKEKTLKIRFFLVSLPDLESALQENDDFALLKQQRAFQSFIEKRDRIPALQRFGYHLETSNDEAPTPVVSLSTITHTEALRSQYESNCRHAITVIAAQLEAIDGFISYFPTISQAILKQMPAGENNATPPSVSDNRLSNQLTNLLSDAQALQKYSDYLNLVEIASDELADTIMALKGYLPAAQQQPFLVLGSAAGAEDNTAVIKDKENRSNFVHYVDIQTKEKMLVEKVARQYLRLYYLCHPFEATAELDALTLTPSAARPARLSQQPIPAYLTQTHLPAYWHDSAEQRSETTHEERLLYKLPSCDRYAIEGYQNKSCREIWERLNDYRDRYNLTFTMLFLKIDSELPTAEAAATDAESALPQFHKFAKQHPGIEHLGGVPKGGTFIVLYEEDGKGGDQAIADFALPYYYRATESNRLPAPPSFSFTYPENQTVITDQESIEVRLMPKNGTVEGESVREDGTYLFDVRSRQQALTKETTLSLAARWENHQLLTPSIRVLAAPFAQFWMGDVKSHEADTTQAVSLALTTDSLPLRLRPINNGGEFTIVAKNKDGEEVTRQSIQHSTSNIPVSNGLFSTNPLTFHPSKLEESTVEITLEYALEGKGVRHSISLEVQTQTIIETHFNRLQAELDTKASKAELDTKASKEELDTKASKEELDAKASKEELDTKASKDELDTKASKEELDTKASKDELETKASKAELKKQMDAAVADLRNQMLQINAKISALERKDSTDSSDDSDSSDDDGNSNNVGDPSDSGNSPAVQDVPRSEPPSDNLPIADFPVPIENKPSENKTDDGILGRWWKNRKNKRNQNEQNEESTGFPV